MARPTAKKQTGPDAAGVLSYGRHMKVFNAEDPVALALPACLALPWSAKGCWRVEDLQLVDYIARRHHRQLRERDRHQRYLLMVRSMKCWIGALLSRSHRAISVCVQHYLTNRIEVRRVPGELDHMQLAEHKKTPEKRAEWMPEIGVDAAHKQLL